MFTTFNLAPFLLLCLYPCRCFQSCLNCCRLNSQVLRTFMDAFQGCYKFEPYDYRYFSGFYLFLRVIILVIFLVTESTYVVPFSGIAIMLAVIFLLIIKPYAQRIYNTIDAIILFLFVLFCYGTSAIVLSNFNHKYRSFSGAIVGIGLVFRTIYVIMLVVYTILPKCSKLHVKRFFRKLTSVSHEHYENALLEIGEDSDDPFLLDRN